MRFITIMGLSLIAKAINESVIEEHGKLFAVITIIALIVDIIDCYKNWRK